MALHVISVGGSLIVPEEIDTDFLVSFKQFIIKRIEKGDKFILISGGGKVCRKYQVAASTVSGIDNEEKDWLGIHATRINAHLLRTIFKLYAHPKVIKDYVDDLNDFDSDFDEKILVGAGWKPGFSSDFDAVLMAEKFGAKSVINLSNIYYAYTQDPRVNPDAKKIEKIDWKGFREIVGNEWDPGMSAPFDPIASRKAEELKLSVAIMNGKDLINLNNYLDGKRFKGTLIK